MKTDILKDIQNSQAAYQEGRSTNEQILALKQIIEKSSEYNKPIYIVFIDYLKAFDSVSQDSVWKALERTSINKNYIKLLQALYKNVKAYVRTDSGIKKEIDIKRGVRQGCVLSCFMFILLISSIVYKTLEDLKNVKTFQRKECEHKSTNQTDLSEHIKAVHRDVKEFHCYECEYTFTNQTDLHEHIKIVHSDV